MSLLRSFPAMAFALVLLAIVAFCVATESFGLLVVAGALAALSWYVTEGPRGRTLPRWVSNILLVAVVLNGVVDWLAAGGPGETMSVLGRFALWLTIIKLYETKGVRDYGHLLALSVVLMIAGCLQSVHLSFGLLLVLYVVLGLYVMLLFQLHVGYERARAERSDGAPDRAAVIPPVEPIIGRRLQRQFNGLVVVTAILGLALSLVFFVIFPRGVLGPDSPFAQFAGRQTGFGEEVRLMDSSRISESRREVFTVQVLDPAGQAIRYPDPLHLRGAVLDQYNAADGKWVTSKRARATSRAVETVGDDVFQSLAAQSIDDRRQTYTLDVTMRSMASDVVFTLYAPIALATEDARTFEFEPMTLVVRDRKTNQLGNYSSYRVRVQPYATPPTMRSLSGEFLRRPPNFRNQTVRQEALRILAEQRVDPTPPTGASPEVRWRHRIQIARALANELQSERYFYTTDLTDFVQMRGRDPIDLFLTEYRFGHCEMFASAMAAMCRSVGVEARLVTGFIGLEFDEDSMEYIVRESNAHAWVEVRSGPYTWATFDPTPPETLNALHEANRSWADSWRWMWDRIEFLWNSRFVGFDSTSQATLADRVNTGWMASGRELVERLRALAARINAGFRLGPAGYIWLGLVGAVVFIATLAIVKILRRAIAIRRVGHLEHLPLPEYRRLLRELGFYVDMLEVLARGGVAKPSWQTPAEYAADLSRSRPEAGRLVHDLVRRFYAVRFGGHRLDADDRRRAEALVAALADQLAVRRPR